MDTVPTNESARLRLGLADIALLAQVQRPVPSVWRRRHARSARPFPAPVERTREQELFDATEVADWLESTERGNNAQARADLAAFAVLDDAPRHDESVFGGLTALLCLRVVEDRTPDSADDLLDLAEEIDPDDDYLYSELESLGERLEPLARYAMLLADAAFHPAAAFEKLVAARFRDPHGSLARTAYAKSALDLAARLAAAIGTQTDLTAPTFVDPAPGGSDLLVALSDQADGWAGLMVATPDDRGPAARLARRRLLTHGVPRVPLGVDGAGGFAIPDGSVLLTQLPSPDAPELSGVDMLKRIDDIVIGSRAQLSAVVIGPASVLVDDLRHDRVAAQVRDDILRTDRVRGIVRLPSGLVTSRPRERLALWCIGMPPRQTDTEPRTLVADLPDTTLDAVSTQDLVADLVAGFQGERALHARAARFTRPVPTRVVRARTGDLLEPAAVTARPAESGALVERILDLARTIADPLTPPSVVPTARAVDPPGPSTIGGAMRARELQLRSGHRLDAVPNDPMGTVRVLDPVVLTGGSGGRSVDRLVLAAHSDAFEFTEPGDVVFCTAPHPAAVVDREGGSVVAFPARILRCRDARFVPGALAADINAQPSGARTWRAWTVRRIPDDQAPTLRTLLDELDRHRAELTDRIHTLTCLAESLVEGAAAGAINLVPHD